MPVFPAIAAALVLATAAIALRPLWRRERLAAAALGAMIAGSAAALYMLVGTPAALDEKARRVPATLDDAVAQLERAMQRDPSQPEGWRLLGRGYASKRQFDKSRDAYAQAARLAPDQPDVLVEAAQASALADPQRRFDPRAVAMLEQALQLQPQHQRARWFLGIAQRQAGKPAQAARTWEPLLAQVDRRTAGSLKAQIDDARNEAGLPPSPVSAAAAGASSLRVRVSLDPRLAKRIRLRGDASVYVIARVPGGPPMPVAVEKHGVGELPFAATLDDGDGPMPSQKLSALGEVEVLARLSMSGNAVPQAGDLESEPVRVRLPVQIPVDLAIGRVRE